MSSEKQTVTIRDKRVEKLLRRYNRDVVRMFDSYITKVQNLILSQKANERGMIELREALNLGNRMADLIGDAGLEDVVENFLDEFEPLTEEALEYFKEFKGFKRKDPLGDVDETHLDAWVLQSEKRLRGQVDASLVAPIQQSFLQAAFGQLPRDAIVEDIFKRGTTLTPAQVVTAVDSSFRDYQRQVTVLKGQELLGENPIYIYVGPDDEITSPQCQAMLRVNRHGAAGMLYQDEITTELHENLRDNPLIHGGHPRCRHQWMPISQDEAIARGFEVDKA